MLVAQSTSHLFRPNMWNPRNRRQLSHFMELASCRNIFKSSRVLSENLDNFTIAISRNVQRKNRYEKTQKDEMKFNLWISTIFPRDSRSSRAIWHTNIKFPPTHFTKNLNRICCGVLALRCGVEKIELSIFNYVSRDSGMESFKLGNVWPKTKKGRRMEWRWLLVWSLG